MQLISFIFNTVFIQPLANGIIVFYHLLGGNLGFAIIVFSFFLRFILNPLTKPYMESMRKMKEFAPQLDKMKKKHKGDKQKLMQAQAEFYKQKGINPGAGCLPYLLQIVILISFVQIFIRVLPADDVALKFNELLYEPLKFSSGEIVNTQFTYLDLSKPDIVKLSFLPVAVPGPILLLAALLQVVSAKMQMPILEASKNVAAKTKEKTDDFQTAMQSSMVYTMPLIIVVFGMKWSSGLALYMLSFAIYQMWQQYKTNGWGGLASWKKQLKLLELPSKKNKK